jgi:hypothetical protein
MKRILIIAMLVAFAQMASGFSPMPQTSPVPASLRRIEVNAKTITALAPGKNYIVDLTQRGVIYEFSSQADQIDFSRVRVRTTQGEVSIGSFMETTLLKDKLPGFNYKSQAFSLGTLPSGTLQDPPTGNSKIINCGDRTCTCSGRDCMDLFYSSYLCSKTWPISCADNPITGEKVCTCLRAWRP